MKQKKKDLMCLAVFSDFEGNVRGLFSTDHLLNCFDDEYRMRYLDIINNQNIKEVFEDKDLFSTIMVFFKCNLNIAKASKEGFMHRNTLMYRLDKVKKLTGLNLKSFEDSVVFLNLITVRDYFEQIKK